jgi:hypothetical protein
MFTSAWLVVRLVPLKGYWPGLAPPLIARRTIDVLACAGSRPRRCVVAARLEGTDLRLWLRCRGAIIGERWPNRRLAAHRRGAAHAMLPLVSAQGRCCAIQIGMGCAHAALVSPSLC